MNDYLNRKFKTVIILKIVKTFANRVSSMLFFINSVLYSYRQSYKSAKTHTQSYELLMLFVQIIIYHHLNIFKRMLIAE